MRAPLFIPCDLRNIEELQAATAQAMQHNGPIQVLCNNAGNDDRHQTKDVTVAYWDDRMAVNLRHQFFAAQAVRPQMSALGGGSIINFGSITWMVGDPDCPAYVTAKAAVYGMTRALAREFGPERIRVNCMVPGWVMTERQMRLWLNAGRRTPDRGKAMPARPAAALRYRAHGAVPRRRRQPHVHEPAVHRRCGLGVTRTASKEEGYFMRLVQFRMADGSRRVGRVSR